MTHPETLMAVAPPVDILAVAAQRLSYAHGWLTMARTMSAGPAATLQYQGALIALEQAEEDARRVRALVLDLAEAANSQ